MKNKFIAMLVGIFLIPIACRTETDYVDKELKSIGQYDPIVQSVVILKEKDGLTLEEIGDRLGYCSRHISRLYSEYKKKRCP